MWLQMNQIISSTCPSLYKFLNVFVLFYLPSIFVCRLVTYSHLPEHAYHAIRILMIITSYPIPQSHMVSYFTSNPQLTINIRHGFVQCLEEEEPTKVTYMIKQILNLDSLWLYAIS